MTEMSSNTYESPFSKYDLPGDFKLVEVFYNIKITKDNVDKASNDKR